MEHDSPCLLSNMNTTFANFFPNTDYIPSTLSTSVLIHRLSILQDKLIYIKNMQNSIINYHAWFLYKLYAI